jgi:chitodextrinase
MTTQTLARVTIATATVAFLALLLFSERLVPAAKADKPAPKADKTAPTTPTNLVVTAITENTVSLQWNASTDNSGKFSYRVKVSWLHISDNAPEEFVSQTQTTYTVQSLAAFGNYSFAVYAVDGSGNRSGDSNLVTANTPGDTIPPSAPVLQATTLAPSQVQLTWTQAVDNRTSYCCTYALTMNGSPLTQHINAATAPSGSLSVIIRHLTPSTLYTFKVTAIDYYRNSSTSNSASAETWPSTDTTPPSVPTNLHVISLDNSGGEAWLGWTQSTDDTDAQNNIEYEIYVNGVLSPLPVSAGVDFDFVYTLNGMCENTFTVKAVDKTGNTSAASAPLTVKLYPC